MPRHRSKFGPMEVEAFHTYYAEDAYPTWETIYALAEKFGLNPCTVKVRWHTQSNEEQIHDPWLIIRAHKLRGPQFNMKRNVYFLPKFQNTYFYYSFHNIFVK